MAQPAAGSRGGCAPPIVVVRQPGTPAASPIIRLFNYSLFHLSFLPPHNIIGGMLRI